MKLVFEINPCAKGRPIISTRNGYAQAYTPLKTRLFERELQTLARQQWKQPALTGALSVAISFYMPIGKWNKKLWGTPHNKKPDLDNLVKTMDAFNSILWHDDGQIAHIDARKMYAEKGRIELYIYKI